MPILTDENIRNEAFEYFFTLRNERSVTKICAKVGERLKLAPRTVLNWYHKYNWQEMAQNKHDKMMATIEGATESLIADEINTMRRVYVTAIEDFKGRVDKGIIKIANFKDFNDCVKTYSQLTNISNASNEKDSRWTINVITAIPRPTGASGEATIIEGDQTVIEVHADRKASASS